MPFHEMTTMSVYCQCHQVHKVKIIDGKLFDLKVTEPSLVYRYWFQTTFIFRTYI